MYLVFLVEHTFHGSIYLSTFAVMAGMAPEGSQFDARQYDTKMTEM